MKPGEVRVLLFCLALLWLIPLLWLLGNGAPGGVLTAYLGLPPALAGIRWAWPRRPWRPDSAIDLLRPQFAALRERFSNPSTPQARADYPRYVALLDRLAAEIGDVGDACYTIETWRETHRSTDDQEFSSSSRHFQLRVDRGRLRTATWSNHASLSGAEQSMGTQTEQRLDADAPDGLRVFLSEMRTALEQPVGGGHVQGVDGRGQRLPDRVAEYGGASTKSGWNAAIV